MDQVCFSPDGTTLSSGSKDKTIRLWDFQTGQQKPQLDSHSNQVVIMSFSPDEIKLASVTDDQTIRLWDVKTGQQNANFLCDSGVWSQWCSLDGRLNKQKEKRNLIYAQNRDIHQEFKPERIQFHSQCGTVED